MFLIFVFFALLSLAGCVQQPIQPSYQDYDSSTYTQAVQDLYVAKGRRTSAQRERDAIKKRLEVSKLNDEIEQLQHQLEKLEEDLRQLEIDIATAQQRVDNLKPTSSLSSSSDTVHTGPRGGRYVITPSGKKRYLKR